MAISRELGIPIVGADLTHAELNGVARDLAAQNPQRYRMRNGFLKKKGDPDFLFNHQSEEAMPPRDKMMAQIIRREAAIGGPVVVILGAVHGNNIHDQGLLQGLDYIHVDQPRREE